MTTTTPMLRDWARELDLLRAGDDGYSAHIERELGSTMLVIRIDAVDFDRIVEELRHDHDGAHERGFTEGFEAGKASVTGSVAS
jgi:hypothetical protein